MYTRRQFIRSSAAAASVAKAVHAQQRIAPFASKFNGVQIGAQTYCYRSLRDTSAPWSIEGVDRLIDRVVVAFVQDQINVAEFWIAMIEPPGGPGRTAVDPALRESLRKWRTSRP